MGESEGELSIAYSNREEEEEDAMAPPQTEARRSKRRNLYQERKAEEGFGGLSGFSVACFGFGQFGRCWFWNSLAASGTVVFNIVE